MVSKMHEADPDLLFVAPWDDPVGLGIFDVSVRFREVSSVLSSELTRSNRVNLSDDRACLPLEQDPGGFAIIDIADPSAPSIGAIVTDIPGITEPYTLAVNRGHLYVFSAHETAMAVFRLTDGADGRSATTVQP